LTICGLVVTAALTVAACGSRPTSPEPRTTSVAGPAAPSAPTRTAAIYAAILDRYLGSPGESSFQPGSITKVFVLAQAHPEASSPMDHGRGAVPIPEAVQRQISELVRSEELIWVDDADDVILRDGCPRVRDNGILITLGTIKPLGAEVKVGINGFVACEGATWLTYVVRSGGTGWKVTGTTGDMAIA
jgi:hypothetical protein